MNTKKKVAIIGLGHQSLEDHLPAVLNSDKVTLIGVADIDNKKILQFKKEHKGIPVYLDYKKLLRKNPDFVIIALPHYLHFEVTKMTIEMGIHVLKEKPFAFNLHDAKILFDLARKNKVKIGVTVQRRFNPIYSTFFQLSSKIGKIFFVEGKYTFFTDCPNTGWRGNKKMAGGGCLIDMGYHMVDLLIWYFGLPDLVFAELSSTAKEVRDYDAEDTAQVVYRYNDSDIWGTLTLSRVMPPKQEFLTIFGTKGYLRIERGKIERFSINGESQETLERKNSWPSAAQDQLECFIKFIEGDKDCIINAKYHLDHMAFIEAAYTSKKEGLYINPKKLYDYKK